ncbi:elongation factor P hydroxylase [Parahaliea sp. F7430]|uniref:Elongation factor P hydroxylase n=1 Tax=Sediminihaliea albiluteola TaxID=2758564 RepID=A0A7W2TUV3_9GAMM|nr:elongation factor P hydroxylase [Sediminihaliea albiluteola]MBA6412395.1 elongation factor P hydroxylase [Sediminihaliea albiluteola]
MTARESFLQAETFCALRLEQVFNRCFSDSERSLLIGGAAEPLYLPAGLEDEDVPKLSAQWHRLYYREDYFASALHEVSHWCIAGPARRLQKDFGYWYAPDGRNAEQQQAFQVVEIKPQALEWCFSQACAYPFRVSLDNLAGGPEARRDELAFKQAVTARARQLQDIGLPARAQIFFRALAQEFGTRLELEDLEFSLAALS